MNDYFYVGLVFYLITIIGFSKRLNGHRTAFLDSCKNESASVRRDAYWQAFGESIKTYFIILAVTVFIALPLITFIHTMFPATEINPAGTKDSFQQVFAHIGIEVILALLAYILWLLWFYCSHPLFWIAPILIYWIWIVYSPRYAYGLMACTLGLLAYLYR